MTWDSANAQGAYIDPGRHLTSALALTVTITATAANGTNKSASIKLKILAPVAPQA